ncbi:MAG: hypothetical protein AB8F95_06205 [Bacteroidia bacterium]
MATLTIGTRIKHPSYGDGIVIDNSMESAHMVVFKNHGEKAIAKDFEGIEIIELAPLPENRIGMGDLEQVMTSILRKWGGMSEIVHMADRWKGGTLELKPADPSMKSKEIPMETFFHKIVMVRDRLRVLEQNINSNKTLTPEEKVHIQQYITRSYGSLTTFNVLFDSKEDYFRGDSKR